ncbi:glycogen-binding domain-containing protein [Longimicrobium sp.]|uniref:glycogen-binding domain-containing protein n=1 Tax=Longimicrobium sp. TaxID=2029185 RepID=UPI003B3AE70B
MMNDRIHQHLDGDRPALTPEERAEADAFARTLDAAAAHLRAVPAPDLAARVMAALPAQAPAVPAWRKAAGWLWNPRPVRLTFRPAYAFAGAALAAVAAIVVPTLDQDEARPVAVAPPAPRAAAPVVYVQFRLESEQARQVALAGTFTGWQPTLQLEQKEPGVWTALVPLKPGVHDYVFVVDGERWVPDPNAPQQVDDSFGGTNSRISLPPLGASA